MLSFTEAQQIVISHARSFGKEIVALDDAFGRVLCEEIKADRDYPPFNRAAVDGIAISYTDWENGIREFVITETIYAGKVPAGDLAKGECYKIMTGAAVPDVADVVIRKEDTYESGNKVSISISSIMPFQSMSKKGEDLKKGEIIINKATKCTPAVIGLLASVGKAKVEVERLPGISIITSGDEVIAVDKPVNDVQIHNSNAPVLKSLLQQWGITTISCEHVMDDEQQIESAISKTLSGDILILNGGVSAGDADYVPSILEKLGAKKIFHKVAIRPGRPIWFGRFENGPVVFALPGNPFSCMVTFKIFIDTFLSASFGITTPGAIALPLQGGRSKKVLLDEFFPVKIAGIQSGVVPMYFNGSGDITAALEADAIAQHPVDINELVNGDIVNCRLF